MLASLIAGFASGETLAALRRMKRAAIYYMVAGLLALLGVIFLLIAAFIWAAREYGPIEAAIGFGVGFIVLSGLTLAIHKLTAGARKRRAASQRNSDMMKVAVAAGIAVLPTLLRGRAGLATVLAPAVAAVAYAIYKENSGGEPSEDGEE
jgi:hypothetical protein